jgi:membrane protein YdbS with pleckstrin-like domain
MSTLVSVATMAFPKHLLADHEELVFDLKPHWVAILPSVLWTIALIIVWVLGYRLAKSVFDDPSVAQNGIAVVVLIAFIWLAVIPFLRWQFTFFVLTTDRLITRSGIVAKHSKEIPLERINDVTFDQSVIERAVGAGDLLVESAGERGQTKISNVRNPEQVQLRIYREVEENNNRMMRGGQPFPTPSGDTIPEQIEALARLRDQGVLSEGEFEAKKQELLRRL